MQLGTAIIGRAQRLGARGAAVCVLALTIVGALLALGLKPSASPALLASPESGPGEATPPQEEAFGGEPIVIAVGGDLATRTLTPEGMAALLKLEGRAAKLGGVQSVYGPATFVNQTVTQMERVLLREFGPLATRADQAAKRATAQARARGASADQAAAIGEQARVQALGARAKDYAGLLTRYGYLGLPSLSNRTFVLSLVYGSNAEPKERFRWLFPKNDYALVIVRPRAGLSDARLRALGRSLTREAERAGLPTGLTVRVGGVPLVVAGVADSFATELLRLAPVVLLAMAIALLLVFRTRAARLWILVPAGLAVLLTAAASRVLGLGLTPATVAALPVVLGLTVDYAVQLCARYDAEYSLLPADDGRPERERRKQAADRARSAVGPTLLVAAGAMAVGFACLTISSVPLVDRLGWTLAVGTLLSVLLVVGLGPPLLPSGERLSRDIDPPGARLHRRFGGGRRLALGRRGTTALVAVLGILALSGFALSEETRVQADVTELAPRGLDELEAVEDLQRELGVAGTLRIAITGDDITRPDALAWQAEAGRRISALDPDLQAGPNLGELLTARVQTPPDAAQVKRLLALIPRYFLDAVLVRDRTRGELTYSIRVGDVHEQEALLRRMRPILDAAPEGIRAEPAGLVALSVESVDELESRRSLLLLLAAFAIFVVLLAVHRRVDRALLPIVPALLTAGLAGAILHVAGLELSPLDAGLEPLVLAVGVEFGLLLDARYREERRRGADPGAAASAARRFVGGAVLASASTVALGFAVLAVSRMEMLQQFGLLVGLEVALCAALAIWLVPGIAVMLEQRQRRSERTAKARYGLDNRTAVDAGGRR